MQFNSDNRVQSTHWRDEQCATLSNPPQVKPMPVAAMVAPPSTKPAQRIALAPDGLFAFGKSGLQDLQPQGRDNLQKLAQQLKTQFRTVHSLIIIGHPDRIGSPKANIDLSQARAQTIKTFLVDQGMAEQTIRAYGVGAAQPVPQTANCGAGQVPTPALVSCLQPNRRVEVEVVGES